MQAYPKLIWPKTIYSSLIGDQCQSSTKLGHRLVSRGPRFRPLPTQNYSRTWTCIFGCCSPSQNRKSLIFNYSNFKWFLLQVFLIAMVLICYSGYESCLFWSQCSEEVWCCNKLLILTNAQIFKHLSYG